MDYSGRYRFGCDIGGTFTDCVLLDEATGKVRHAKVLTVPEDPSEGVMVGCQKLLGGDRDIGSSIRAVIHGTTLVINAILERKGVNTGLITTSGFRDVLEMRRYMRGDMFDVFGDLPAPLVERTLREEIPERVYADGQVLTPLDEEAAKLSIQHLLGKGVESIAVCFLHSYISDVHEQRVKQIIRKESPDTAVSLSSEVSLQAGEFERTSSTVANAYVQPLVQQYLERLANGLVELGLNSKLLLMLSGGGLVAADTVKQFPIRLVESGPVAGALAAKRFGELTGVQDVLAFDMGGTTAKACHIQRGELPITTEYEVDRSHHARKGSGLPLAVPSVDMIEVGTGGGSIASIDDFGRVKVGPQSAGANPGPACYGRGGVSPTVTDADLVLGYLDPDFFLGGEMSLDQSKAESAIADNLAEPMKTELSVAAWGIVDIAVENMASAMRMHIAERGGDPTVTTIVASGGAGPIHAFALLRKLRAKQLVLPGSAGVMSALGMLMAPVSFEVMRTFNAMLESESPPVLNDAFQELEGRAEQAIADALPDSVPAFERSVDIQHEGQGYPLTIPVSDEHYTEGEIAPRLCKDFRNIYKQRYGYEANAPIQLTALRVRASAPAGDFRTEREPEQDQPLDVAIRRNRPAYDPAVGEFTPHVVYDRYLLRPGMHGTGPAIIEERESTAVIGTEGKFVVDGYGSLVVSYSEPSDPV